METEKDFIIRDADLLDYVGVDTDVVIPDGVKRIGRAFYKKNVTSVTMPGSVIMVCNAAFFECERLEKVTFSAKLNGIYTEAFYGCTALKEVHLPESLLMIGPMAFARCTSLNNVVIPDKVGMIRDGAFYGCSALSTITLPKSFLFGEDLFYGNVGPLDTLTLWDSSERPAERILTVNYAGERATWAAIARSINTSFISVVHCINGDITY